VNILQFIVLFCSADYQSFLYALRVWSLRCR